VSLLTEALVAAGAETRRGLGYSIPKRRDARLVTSAPAIAGPVSVLAVLTLSGFGLMLPPHIPGHFFARMHRLPRPRVAKMRCNMSETTEGAGPAIAAHSKDASTPGQSPASAASGEARPASHEGEAVNRLIEQAAGTVRSQPLVSAGILIAAGIVIGKLLSRR
jgi:ElaB/YqjD/DUF883 family membrane-anchored ribosome-binding protein